LETEILAEKWQNMILESFRHLARVSSLIYLEIVFDSVVIEHTVQLASVNL